MCTIPISIDSLPFWEFTITACIPDPCTDFWPDRKIGRHIKSRRDELGWTQKKLAHYLNVKAHRITMWENNQVNINIRVMPRIIDWLGFNPILPHSDALAARVLYFRVIMGLRSVDLCRLTGLPENYLQGVEHGMLFGKECETRIEKALVRAEIQLENMDGEQT